MLRRNKLYAKIGLIIAAIGIGGICSNIYASEQAAKVAQDNVAIKDESIVVTPEYFQKDTKSYIINAIVPQVSSSKYKESAKIINDRINKEMKETLESSINRGNENYEAYIATGGKDSEYRPIDININYEVKYNVDGIVSIAIYKSEAIASTNEVAYLYNFDFENKKDITLKDFYGEDYKKIIDDQIISQMKERIDKEDANYFDEFKGIEEDQSFYINEKGNPVIVFNKYDIAPGFMGMQYFEISNPVKKLQLEAQAHYDVKKSILPKNELVSYPIVEGYKGELLQSYINQSLFSVVEKYQKDTYSNLMLNYKVTNMDDNILSVIYWGNVDIKGLGTKMILDSVNIDLSKDKTVKEINVQNFIMSDKKSQTEFNKILQKKLKEQGIEDKNIEGLRLYFKDSRAVFYYVRPDDSVQKIVEIQIPITELEQVVNL